MGNLINWPFRKKRVEKIDTSTTKFPQKTIYVRPIRERLEVILENNTEAEKRKQMELLYTCMPFLQVEETFKDELANRLFSLGYERSDENALEDLVLDQKEIEVLEQINQEKLNGNIDKQANEYLENDIYSFVSKIKVIMDMNERFDQGKPNIMKILNKEKKSKEKGYNR